MTSTFSHDGVNGPESKIMRVFSPVCQMTALVGRQTMLFGRIYQVVEVWHRGTKSAVSDCILLWKRTFGDRSFIHLLLRAGVQPTLDLSDKIL